MVRRFACRFQRTAGAEPLGLRVARRLLERRPPGRASERGDVPGWVMVTLMTAGLVAVIWALAGQRLQALFNQAMNMVSST